ncbi:MAG: VOC family protein [Hyphomicrobiales bacterium]
MGHLSKVILNVRSPKALADFYCRYMGMRARARGDTFIIGYDGIDADIELRPAEAGAYVHNNNDRYWKIGITLPNVDIAYEQLSAAGVEVSTPRQFQDIGYMCHLADLEGFVIELLQHDFEGNRPDNAGDAKLPLGGGGRIGQITLRTSNIEEELQNYRDSMGMRLLSIQPVRTYGFTLYFLAFTAETPPDPNLEAVVNREWLWKRPYTTLELQCVGVSQIASMPSSEETGFGGILFT